MKVGLECVVGGTRVAIPVEAVDQIIEYQLTSPLPLARAYVGGLGTHERRVVLSVQLAPETPAGGAPLGASVVRNAKGVLLDVKGSRIGWALEVASVASFVQVEVADGAARGEIGHQPPWVSAATALDDGRAIAWVDVAAMVAALEDAGDDGP